MKVYQESNRSTINLLSILYASIFSLSRSSVPEDSSQINKSHGISKVKTLRTNQTFYASPAITTLSLPPCWQAYQHLDLFEWMRYQCSGSLLHQFWLEPTLLPALPRHRNCTAFLAKHTYLRWFCTLDTLVGHLACLAQALGASTTVGPESSGHK